MGWRLVQGEGGHRVSLFHRRQVVLFHRRQVVPRFVPAVPSLLGARVARVEEGDGQSHKAPYGDNEEQAQVAVRVSQVFLEVSHHKVVDDVGGEQESVDGPCVPEMINAVCRKPRFCCAFSKVNILGNRAVQYCVLKAKHFIFDFEEVQNMEQLVKQPLPMIAKWVAAKGQQ